MTKALGYDDQGEFDLGIKKPGRDEMGVDRAEARRSPRSLYAPGSAGFGNTEEDDKPISKKKHRDRDVIQRWLRKDWFRNWLKIGLTAMLALCVCVPAGAEEVENVSVATPKGLYLACIGQGDNPEALIAYCHGYLSGHWAAVAASPTDIYCIDKVSVDMLTMLYKVWYLQSGQDAKEVPNALWYVWTGAGVCYRKAPVAEPLEPEGVQG
jgi:hypothetical protein